MSRTQTALILGASFPALFISTLGITSLVPIVGPLSQAAVHFGSPLVWLLVYADAPTDVLRASYGIAIAVPYLLAGLVLGCLSPIATVNSRLALRAILVRFGLTWLAISSIGLWLALHALAHDS
jgi:hypothetical protein